jgi:hypothetical protein
MVHCQANLTTPQIERTFLSIALGDACFKQLYGVLVLIIALGDACFKQLYGVVVLIIALGDACFNQLYGVVVLIIALGDACFKQLYGVVVGPLFLKHWYIQNSFRHYKQHENNPLKQTYMYIISG